MPEKRKRVLIVDDYDGWRRSLASALQKKKELQVIGEASDGLQAVQKAQELQPDLILLDLGLPNLNGIEAARRIREISPISLILFVSENHSVDVVEEALRTGAGGYVVKSHVASELLPAVNAVLEGERFVSASLSRPDLADIAGTEPSEHSRRVGILTPTQEKVEIRRDRKAGIRRHHEAEFYPDDAAFVDGFARFIEGALKRGSPVILVATTFHRASLFQRLKADGVDVDAVIEQRMYIPLDVEGALKTFMVGDSPDPGRLVTVAGDAIRRAAKTATGDRRHVAACGECAPWLLAQGNAQAAIRLERLWDEIARTYDVDFLCGYVASAFFQYRDDTVFQRICAEHSAVHELEMAH